MLLGDDGVVEPSASVTASSSRRSSVTWDSMRAIVSRLAIPVASKTVTKRRKAPRSLAESGAGIRAIH